MSRPRPSHRLALLLTALVLLVAACGSSDASEPAKKDTAIRGALRTPPLQVATISLPNVADGGAALAMRAPRGQLLLVYFGYTSCPDVCPTTLSDLRVAVEKLPDGLAKRVQVAMATVDPERDTAKVLSGYIRSFFDKPIALRTDDPATLKAATEAFSVQFEIAPHEAGATEYEVGHSGFTYVVDDTGTVVVEWPFGFRHRDMTHDLITILDKET